MKTRKLLRKKRLVAAVVAGAVVLAIGAAVAIRSCSRGPAPLTDSATVYQCPMHPQIVQDHPGKCPICHMDLVKVARDAAEGRAPKGKVVRYRNPMDPTKFSDKPMKDSMGMDYLPVYEDEAVPGKKGGVPGKVAFTLSEERQQLIGVKTGNAERRNLSRRLRLPGRVSGERIVVAELLEMDAGTVREGMKAQLNGPQEQKVDAVVTGVDSSFDAVTRSYEVTLEATEDASWLRPGVYCEVDVVLDFGKRLAIPADAVLMSGERKVVFLADGKGRFEPREVRLGKAGEDWVEVLSGLKEGNRVVTSANFLIDSESQFKAALEQFK